MSKTNMDLSKMKIILPGTATVAEQGAAEELREHMEKMCGVTLSIGNETDTPAEYKAIYIGNTAFAKENQVSFPDNSFGEGWAIKAVDGNLVLCGGKVRGANYAVYHLLEDVLGCRWWTIWEESIPKMEAVLVADDIDLSGVPSMEFRDVFAWPTETQSRFFVRNRLNGFMAYAPAEFGGNEYFGEPAHIHTYDRYFPEKYNPNPVHYTVEWGDLTNPNKEDYFTTHPEWFAMTGRRKRVPRFLCMSNEGLQQAFAERLLKTIAYSYEKADAEGKIRPRYFDISPADSFGECACPQCRASIEANGSSGHQLQFINKMAEAVEEIYPEAVIDTVAYWHYVEPPKSDIKPRANVSIRFADNYMDILHDIRHKNNEGFLRRMSAWSKLCAQGRMYVWDYGLTYGPNGVFPSMYKMGENFRTFKEVGINGYFMEMEHPINTDFWDMKVWLSTKLMENPDLDFRTLMDDFIDGYYGVAAPYIRRYLDAMHILAEKNPGCYRFGASIIAGDGMTVADIIAGDREFAAAFAAAEGDEVIMRRLYDARSGLDRVIVENYDRLAAEAAQAGLALPEEKVIVGRRLFENYTRQVAFRGDWDYMGEEARVLYEKYTPGYVAPKEVIVELTEHKRLANLNGCANAWTGPEPEIVEEAVLSAYPEEKQYIFHAIEFSTSSPCVVDDPDAPSGQCCVFDAEEAMRKGFCQEELVAQKWAIEDEDPSRILPIGIYTGKLDEEKAPISNLWGSIRKRNICADGKYHLYKFSDVEMPESHPGTAFHMFRSWGLTIYTLPRELVDLIGKKLDFYLSMKVTGDVSCQDRDNLPAYYIDRFIVVEK